MQAGPELSNGLKERQIACIEGTMGFHVARMIHIYLYAANRLWDTHGIPRLRRLPLTRRAMTLCGKNPRCQREERSSGSMTRAWSKIRQGGHSAGKARRIIPQIIEKNAGLLSWRIRFRSYSETDQISDKR